MAYNHKHLPLMLFGAALTPIAAIQLLLVDSSAIALGIAAFLVMMAGVAISMGSFHHMHSKK